MKLFTRLIVQIKGTITYFWPQIMNVNEVKKLLDKNILQYEDMALPQDLENNLKKKLQIFIIGS